MKKHFVSVILALFVLTSLNAQNFKVGVQGGVDAARLAISGASGGPLKYRTELAGGLFAEGRVSENFGVQLEVNYSEQGTGIINDDGGAVGSFRMSYVTIPVLAKLYGSPRLSFFAGPQIGILLDAERKLNGEEDQDVKDQFKKTDIYAVFGSEYNFANGLFISARYNMGMTNVADEDLLPEQEFKQRYFSFRIGYAFKL